MALDLGKQVGPLPVGAWVAVVGGGLAIGWYFSKGTAANNSANDALVPVTEPGVGTGGGQFIYDPPTNVENPNNNAIADNATWGRRAINWLIAEGYDPGLAQSAVSKFLNGTNRTLIEQTLINLALVEFGTPPEEVPLPETPVTPPPTTPPPTTTPPPAAKPYVLHKVLPGENIVSIAAKYKTTWGNIFTANDKVGLTPSGSRGVLYGPWDVKAGMTLVIPTSSRLLTPAPKVKTTGVRYYYYTVPGRTGELISQISKKTGANWANIFVANDVVGRRPDGSKGIVVHPYQRIKPGVRVVIPHEEPFGNIQPSR